MDTAKKPASLVAGGALITALTTAVYLNKQQNMLSGQIDEIKDHLSSAIGELKNGHDRVDRHEKHISTIAEGVRQLNALKMEQNEMFEYFYQVLMDRGKVIEALVESVSEIQEAMVKNGTKFKNGPIRDVVDVSEQESLPEITRNAKSSGSSVRHDPVRQTERNYSSMDREDPAWTGMNERNISSIHRGADTNGFDRASRNNFHQDQGKSPRSFGHDEIGVHNRSNGYNARPRQAPPTENLGDSDEEIEAEMEAMRKRRGNQLMVA